MTEFKVGDKVRVKDGGYLSTIISIGNRSDGRLIVTVENQSGACITWAATSLEPVNIGYAVRSIYDNGHTVAIFSKKSWAENYIDLLKSETLKIVEIETDLFVDKNK